jgi:hypothetical protein
LVVTIPCVSVAVAGMESSPHTSTEGTWKQDAPPPCPEPGLMTLVLKHWGGIAGACVSLAVAVIAFMVFTQTKVGVVNLMNADAEELKEYLLRRPSILYCDAGGGKGDTKPQVFTDLQKLIGNEFYFATLNCDQTLPSGKTLYEKYNLNKNTIPTIFGVAPWAPAVQASYSNLKTAPTLRLLFEGKLAPKANIATSTFDLLKACGWAGRQADGGSRLPPCIAVAKGDRYNDDDINALKLAMKKHTKAKYVTFLAKDRRLNVEDAGSYNPKRFGARYYALRNDSYFLAMKKPPTSDNVLNFIANAINIAPEEYSTHSSPNSLVKYIADRIKEYNEPIKKSRRKSKTEKKKAEEARPSDAPPSDEEEEDQELLALIERQQREADIRERMSQEEQSYIFEDEEGGGEGEGEGDIDVEADSSKDDDDEDDDEDIIEL